MIIKNAFGLAARGNTVGGMTVDETTADARLDCALARVRGRP